MVVKNDLCFQQALLAADLLLPDGSGIVLAAKQISKEHVQKLPEAMDQAQATLLNKESAMYC